MTLRPLAFAILVASQRELFLMRAPRSHGHQDVVVALPVAAVPPYGVPGAVKALSAASTRAGQPEARSSGSSWPSWILLAAVAAATSRAVMTPPRRGRIPARLTGGQAKRGFAPAAARQKHATLAVMGSGQPEEPTRVSPKTVASTARRREPEIPEEKKPQRGLPPALWSLLLANFANAADAAEPLVKMTDEAIRATNGELGWWGSYIKGVEDAIFLVHDFLGDAGVPGPYGVSIALFVVGVKLVTLPLNWQQLSTSSQMKAIQPQIKSVKKWYGDNKDLMNMETGLLFEKAEVNPLAGILPSFVQIPVFLGVYYSVTSIARAKIYDEGFLWIPSLTGPIADRTEGIKWLTENWVNGAPALGWHDTLCYLTIPCILVCTQTGALYLLGSFDALDQAEDSASKTTGTVLRLLPFFLGWVALNAPSALGVYWVCNNVLTTATTLTVKKLVETDKNFEVDVDIAALGPRRAPQLVAEVGTAPDWSRGTYETGNPTSLREATEAPRDAGTADVPVEENAS